MSTRLINITKSRPPIQNESRHSKDPTFATPRLFVQGGTERNLQKFPQREGCPPPSHRPREAVEAPDPKHLHLFPKTAWQSPSVAEDERIPLTLSFRSLLKCERLIPWLLASFLLQNGQLAMDQHKGKAAGWELNKLFPFGRPRGDGREQSTSPPRRWGEQLFGWRILQGCIRIPCPWHVPTW